MSENDLLTWQEASRLYVSHGLSVSTFQRRITDKEIKPLPGGKRDKKYPRENVLAVLAKEKKPSRKKNGKPSGVTDWVRIDDLPHLLELDYQLYGEYTVDSTVTQHWWKKNGQACRILFNEHDRTDIWGCLSIIPVVNEEIAIRLASEQMSEDAITADDIPSYKDGGKFVAYVPSAAIHPKHKASLPKLINSVIDFLCSVYPDVQIVKFYAFASSDEGLELMKYFFFSPRYDLGPNTFELDPYRRNPSPFVKRFQRCIENKAA